MDIGTLQAQGALSGTTGATLVAQTLSSGAAMQLDAAGALQIQRLTSNGDFIANAGGLLAIDNAAVGGQAGIDGGTDVQLGNATVAQSLVLNAGGAITVGSAAVDGSMTLRAGQSIEVGTAAIGVDGDWVAGTHLSADEVTVGCNFRGDAGAWLAIGTLNAGCGIGLSAHDALRFDALQAAGGIALASRGSDVQGRQLDAGTLQVQAAGDIRIEAARAGGDLVATSGGTQQWGAYQAGGNATLQAGRDIQFSSGRSGGAHSIIAGGSIGFERASAGTTAYMDAQAGSVAGGQLQAAAAQLSARDTLSLAQAMVDTRLNLAADDVQAQVRQSDAGEGVLTTTLTGYRNGVARRIVVDVQPRDAWLIDALQAMEAQLTSSSSRVAIADGHVERSMTLTTPSLQLLMDNTSPVLRPADAQLMQLNRRFHLAADGRLLDTNAYVLRFNDGVRVSSPNYNREHIDAGPAYLGESAVRYMGRMLNLRSPEMAVPARAPAEGDEAKARDVVTPAIGGAVNLGAPN